MGSHDRVLRCDEDTPALLERIQGTAQQLEDFSRQNDTRAIGSQECGHRTYVTHDNRGCEVVARLR